MKIFFRYLFVFVFLALSFYAGFYLAKTKANETCFEDSYLINNE